MKKVRKIDAVRIAVNALRNTANDKETVYNDDKIRIKTLCEVINIIDEIDGKGSYKNGD